MATTESVLVAHIEACRPYAELPPRVKERVPVDDWLRRSLAFHARRADAFEDAPELRAAIDEGEYYASLIKTNVSMRSLFPYHLAGPLLSRGVTPFSYYTNMLQSYMYEEGSYDQLPNILSADVVRVLGVGRNEYIAAMNAAKALKMQWRLNRRQAVAKQLPAQPKDPPLKPWWRVCSTGPAASAAMTRTADMIAAATDALDNAAAAALTRDHDLLQLLSASASDHDGEGVLVGDLHSGALLSARRLLRRGAAYVIVPVAPEDAFVVPPLEGFVSNKNTAAGDDRLSIEQLVYAVLLAASERVAVVELADLLDAPVRMMQRALSLACRLGFAVPASEAISARQSISGSVSGADGVSGSMGDGAVAGLDDEATSADSLLATPTLALNGGRCFAFVLDNEAVGLLMMNLSPGLMMHAVTLLEAGRLQADASRNLLSELEALPPPSSFERGVRESVEMAEALRVTLSALLRAGVVEVFRSDALQTQMGATATARLLASFDAVVCTTGAPVPLLAVAGVKPPPALAAPMAVAASAWAKLALFVASRRGPRSIVLPRGTRLSSLPSALRGARSVTIVPWPSEGGNSGSVGGGSGGGGGGSGGGGGGGSARKPQAQSTVHGDAAAILSALNGEVCKHALLAHVAEGGSVEIALPLATEGERRGGDGGEEADDPPTELAGAAAAWASAIGVDAMPGSISAHRDASSGEWVPCALSLGFPLHAPAACAASADRVGSAGLLEPAALRLASRRMRRLARLARAIAAFSCSAEPGQAFDADAFERADPSVASLDLDASGYELKQSAAESSLMDQRDADALPELALGFDGRALRAFDVADCEHLQAPLLAQELAALG